MVSQTANLKRLFTLRTIAITGQVTAVIIAVELLDIRLPILPISTIIAALTLFNFLAWYALQRQWHRIQPDFFSHLLVDVIALSALLYFSGGASNPFVLLFLLPLTISATLLPGRYTWALAGATVICYTFLMRYHVDLTHAHGGSSSFDMHVLGMWLGFVLSSGLIAYFVVGMGKTMRQQADDLACAREQALRDEQMVARGMLAATTAHELSTPLATVSLITADLQEDCTDACPQIRQRLATLGTQVERCKAALSTLSASAGEIRLAGGGPMRADLFLQQLLREWKRSQPDTFVHTHWEDQCRTAPIMVDRMLNQALINILDNAAQASPDQVEWRAHIDQDELIMEILDRGAGLTSEAKQRVGKEPFTTKPEGMGLGLFLAHAVISRLGGYVTLFNRDGGGLCTRIQLPCLQLNDSSV
ncbi:two-component sensor histidine kinase [Thiohalobacter sp. COW1]|uniref:histidine kinase n=2 Tax=Thiohalobacteraceae TaxID=3085110 RepID=A0A1Z4VP20_9GAMM|nr:sensor histidine kinase [Thiohalobacter thiocyanaticus]BCO31728.1 two-component sensor histidine kinase [Thiohalobacter sp. COW1]